MKLIIKYLHHIAICLILVLLASESSAQCGTDTLLTVSGTFDDGSGTGNYSSNTNCTWLIQPTNNPLTITLTMNSVNLSIFNDRVRVYDGTDNTGTLLATYTFNNTGSPVTAFSGSMFVEFTTDGFANAQGWSASYISATSYCQLSSNLTANAGTFSDGSPDGGNYFDSTDCSWLIQPTMTNMAIRLNFNRFDTEAGNDIVTIYDGATTSDPILATYSGTSTPAGVTSSSANMLVTFQTDSANAANGWEATYQTQPIPSCNGLTTLTAASGVFNDGSSNGTNYVQNSNCSWLISPPGAINIDLNFNYFDTQNNADEVKVYDGIDNSGTLLGTFSGNSIPPSVTAISGNMFIEFTSDFRFNGNGWEVSYTSSNVVTLDAIPDSVFINAGGGSSASFSVNSNIAWTVTENANWLIPAPAFGNGNGSVNLIAIQGNIGPERYAPVYINATSSSNSDTIIAVQASSGRFISASPDTLFFDAIAANSQTINLSTNVSWNANSTANWINFTPSSGTNNGSISVNVQDNPGGQRNDFIVISGNLGASNDTVHIIQDSIPPSLSVDPQNITLAQAAGSSSSFTVNSTINWQTQSSATWLSVTNPIQTVDTAIVQVTADSMNLSINNRSAFIAVQDIGGTLFDTVFVTQSGGTLILSASPKNIMLNSLTGSSANGVLNSNISWTASPADSWISINPTNGNDTTNLTITANSTNTDLSPRSSYIAFESSVSNLVDTIFVDQMGTTPILSVNPNTISMPRFAGAVDSFMVLSNTTNWNINGSAAWLTINSPITSDSATVIISTLSSNNTTSPRTVTLIVQDSLGNLTDSVVITQDGLAGSISANPDAITLDFANGSSDSVVIASDVSWSIANNANWLQVSPDTGSNNGLVIISALSANNSGSSRTAILSVDAPGAISDTITVTQIDGSNPTFELSKDTVFIDSSQSSTGTFSVLSNVSSWTLNENSSWLLVNPTSGSASSVITVLAVAKNVFGSPRYATITASAQGFSDRTVVVAQRGVTPVFQASANSILVGSDSASTADFDITSNLPSWSISENISWLEVTPLNGAFIQTVTVKAVEDNNTGSQRSDTINVTSPPLVPKTIIVTQDTIMTIGIKEELRLENSILLYPNPTSGELNIQIDNEFVGTSIEAKLFNILGEELPIRIDFSTSNRVGVNLSNQAKGIYLLSIRYKESTISRKISLTK